MNASRARQSPALPAARAIRVSSEDLRFTRLRMKNLKNFVNVDVVLARRSFIVGPNAAGKSDLLDAFRFFHDFVAVGGEFQAAVERRHGVPAIRSLAARRDPEITLEATLGNHADEDAWRYELRFKKDRSGGALITSERAWQSGKRVFARPDKQDGHDAQRLTKTYLEQTSLNHDYRAIANAFRSLRYLYIVPQLFREPERSFGRKDDPFDGDFLETIARTPARTRESRLDRNRKALGIAVPQLAELRIEPDVRGVWHLRGKYARSRPQGAWQDEDQFSDATLRLIGLLWSILDRTGPLLLEEPELSLHSAVIGKIPQMIARMQSRNVRQVIISTHSVEMLSDSGIGAEEVVLISPSYEGSRVFIALAIHRSPRCLMPANARDGSNALDGSTRYRRSSLIRGLRAPMNPLMCVVEGYVDEAVAQTLAACAGFSATQIVVKGGRAKIAARVHGYFRASGPLPWFGLVDLDRDPCPSTLLQSWTVPPSAASFVCRVTIREIEAWLPAGRERFTRFSKVSPARLPIRPEDISDPKRFIVELAGRSRSREIRSDIQPTLRSRRHEGPAYSSRLTAFVRSHWRPRDARAYAPSLDSCMKRLEQLRTSLSPFALPVSGTVSIQSQVFA